MPTDRYAETASADLRGEAVPVMPEGSREADGADSGLITLVREDASDPDLPSAVELRVELLALQQRLEVIVGDDDRAPARIAADSVASERIAALAQQVRQFHHAVQARRRLSRGWQRWFRGLWSRPADAQPVEGAATVSEPAERAYRDREARTVIQMFEAGLHHLR